MQYSYIAKAVAYGCNYSVCMFAARKTTESVPSKFTYYFELDIDPAKTMTIRFRKRGQDITGFYFTLDPQDHEYGIFGLSLPNIVTFPNQNYTLNLFDAHIRSDTVVFEYTSSDGKPKEFRFPLTGFNERYLEQFV